MQCVHSWYNNIFLLQNRQVENKRFTATENSNNNHMIDAITSFIRKLTFLEYPMWHNLERLEKKVSWNDVLHQKS